MSFPDRLRMVIKQSGLKRDQFAFRSKKSRNQIFKYLKGDNLPTADFFQVVKSEFPWVNIEWFITGVGEMYSSAQTGSFSQEINGDQTVWTGDEKVSANSSTASGALLTQNEHKFVNIQYVMSILEDYVAPKIVKEIEEKLKKNI